MAAAMAAVPAVAAAAEEMAVAAADGAAVRCLLREWEAAGYGGGGRDDGAGSHRGDLQARNAEADAGRGQGAVRGAAGVKRDVPHQ